MKETETRSAFRETELGLGSFMTGYSLSLDLPRRTRDLLKTRKVLQSQPPGFFSQMRTHKVQVTSDHIPQCWTPWPNAPAPIYVAHIENAQLLMPSYMVKLSPLMLIVSYICGVIARACLCQGPRPPLTASSLLRQRPGAGQRKNTKRHGYPYKSPGYTSQSPVFHTSISAVRHLRLLPYVIAGLVDRVGRYRYSPSIWSGTPQHRRIVSSRLCAAPWPA